MPLLNNCMKKTPLLILIPLIAVLSIVAAAVIMKTLTSQPEVVLQKTTEFPNSIGSEDSGKPSTFLGGLFGQNKATSTPTPSPASAAQFTSELKDTYDDGDQAEFDALTKDAASL